MNLLLIEDNENIATGLIYAFKKNNHQLMFLTNVEDAKKYLQTNTPALIILDVSLPDGNGFEIVYHHIKANSVPLMYRRGTPVREGILLGNVSTTGLSTGFHLHVGLKINGEQADVLEYVDFNYKR